MNIPLHPGFLKILLKLKRKTGDVKPADPIWPEQAARYEEFGAGVFSNEFYDDVLLKAGLVVKRSKHAAKDENGNRILKQGRQVNPISFHCLRHTFVSLVKLTGGSQAVAKELAGHSSDAVSDLYTHVPEEALSKAIKKLPEVTK
jgi:integrase